jgi:hypothetical protein
VLPDAPDVWVNVVFPLAGGFLLESFPSSVIIVNDVLTATPLQLTLLSLFLFLPVRPLKPSTTLSRLPLGFAGSELTGLSLYANSIFSS